MSKFEKQCVRRNQSFTYYVEKLKKPSLKFSFKLDLLEHAVSCQTEGWPNQCNQERENREPEAKEEDRSLLGMLKSLFGRSKKNEEKSNTDNFIIANRYFLIRIAL